MPLPRLTAATLLSLALTAPLAVQAAGCPNCGQVIDVREYRQEGRGSGVGAVAGGVVGGVIGHQIGRGRGNTLATVAGVAGGAYAGHQVEKKVKTHTAYQVTVQLEGGATQHVNYSQKPAFLPGDRVRLDNGRLTRLPN